MLHGVNLGKASNSILSGIQLLEDTVGDISNNEIPKIRRDLSRLDKGSPMYHLQAKSIGARIEKIRQDVQASSSFIALVGTNIQQNAIDFKRVEQEVKQIELDNEMAVAGFLEKMQLSIARGVNSIFSSVLKASNFFKVDYQTTALTGTALLSGAAAFSAGYLYANLDGMLNAAMRDF
jgi:hypothetical protein